MTVRILTGDAKAILKTMDEESVDMVCTSPPYYALRDYQVDGQLGLESTPAAYLDAMVGVFREVKRVLKKTGTCWVNMGDSYASAHGGDSGRRSGLQGSLHAQDESKRAKSAHSYRRDKADVGNIKHISAPGLKPKDLIGMPWRLALALQAGYSRCTGCELELRTDLWPVWDGERVCIDCVRMGRGLHQIRQSERGFYLRQDIIWEKSNAMPESARDRCTKSHEYLFLLAKTRFYHYDAKAIAEDASPNTHPRMARAHGGYLALGQEPHKGILSPRPNAGVHKKVSGWAHGSKGKHSAIEHARTKDEGRAEAGLKTSDKFGRGAGWRVKQNPSFSKAMSAAVLTKRNKRSVWSIPSSPYSEAHFATFPTALVEPCILAGCPLGGTVLDCFAGAGTVGLVADRLQRHAVLIELNPAYADMAKRRIRDDSPLLAEVAA